MNILKIILRRLFFFHLILVGFICAGVSAADAPTLELEQTPELADIPATISGVKSARDMIGDYLNARPELQLGDFKMKDGRMAVTWDAYATVNAPVGSPGYGDERWRAFQEAMLNVKQKCAEFQAAQVKSELEASYSRPDEERAQAAAEKLSQQGLDKDSAIKVSQAINSDSTVSNESSTLNTPSLYTQKIINNKLDADLKAKGIDPNKPVDKSQVAAILNSVKFQEATNVQAIAKCSGLQALVTVENTPANKKGQIGVLAIWTEKLHSIAEGFGTGNWALVPKGEPGLKVAQHLPQSNRAFLATFGTQLVRDETGQYVLLAFAQASPASDSPREIDFAYRRADTLATGLIRQFIGEQIAMSEDLMSASEATEYKDKSETYSNKSAYASMVKAVADKQSIPGIVRVAGKEMLHPAANTPVVIVVKALKASSIQNAARMTEIQNRPTSPSGQPSNVTNSRSGGPQKPTGSFNSTGSGGKDF